MRSPQKPTGSFQKVGACLYRSSSNGVYYARIKSHGKEIRLRSTDQVLAQRLSELHRGRSLPVALGQ